MISTLPSPGPLHSTTTYVEKHLEKTAHELTHALPYALRERRIPRVGPPPEVAP